MSNFSRARTQVLYKYMPGALFIHDTYGVCLVTSVDLDPNIEVNQNALFDALRDYLSHWENEEFRKAFVFNYIDDLSRFYVIGEPGKVRFKPYPEVLECTSCGRVFELKRVKGCSRPGKCPSCGSAMRQLRYVEAHNCGRIEAMYVPSCKAHGYDHVRFMDTGRFRSATWRCIKCGDRQLQGTGQRACKCSYSYQFEPTSSERRMKGFPVTSPALHLVHTIPFLNLPSSQIDDIAHDPRGRVLALARSCGILERPVLEVIAKTSNGSSFEGDPLAEFVELLRQSGGVSEEFIQEQLSRIKPKDSPAGIAITELKEAFSSCGGIPDPVPQRVIEHAAVIDSSGARSIDAVIEIMQSVGDNERVAALHGATQKAAQMGLQNLRVMDSFPMALCAAGYTRATRKPDQSIISPFGSLESDNRIPLYVLSNTTEAIYFQLNPVRVLDWLRHNGLVESPGAHSEVEAWAVLYDLVPGLLRKSFQDEYVSREAIIVRTLLHTISHSFLRNIEWSGYDSESIGEFMFPEVLACVLYANRFQETKIGGLLTLFEQGLEMWLDQSRDEARSCLYDPLCEDSGGSCVGCMHREYGCIEFNKELSRSALFSGRLPLTPLTEGDVEISFGYWAG